MRPHPHPLFPHPAVPPKLAHTHLVNVEIASSSSSAAGLNCRVAMSSTAWYTLSRFLRSQSPPLAHSAAARSRPALTPRQSPRHRSSLRGMSLGRGWGEG